MNDLLTAFIGAFLGAGIVQFIWRKLDNEH